MKILLLMLLLTISVEAAAPKNRDSREKIVNQTLDMTLAVGAAFRAQNKKVTWDDISVTVAERMKVKRTKPGDAR